jgi:hypothetical protein
MFPKVQDSLAIIAKAGILISITRDVARTLLTALRFLIIDRS